MNSFQAFWDAQPWYVKLLIVAGIPLLIFIACFEEGRSLIANFVETRARKTTDAKVDALEVTQAKADKAAAEDEGKLSVLESQLANVKKPGTAQDVTDYFNEKKP